LTPANWKWGAAAANLATSRIDLDGEHIGQVGSHDDAKVQYQSTAVASHNLEAERACQSTR